MSQFLRVKDERLDTCPIEHAKYVVKQGPRTNYTSIPSQNLSTNGTLVYNLNNIGPNSARNRTIWVECAATVVLNGSGLTAPTAGQLAFKCFPFNRNLTQVQHTLNGASETYLTNQNIDWLAQLKTYAACMQGYDNSQPDNCQDYLTGISNLSPLTSYTSSIAGATQKPRNVGIQSAVVTNGGANLTITAYWWEPLITPFSCVSENNKNLPCLWAIDGETITLVSNGFTDLLAYNPAIGTVNSQTVNLTAANLWVEYITANDIELPAVSLYQFPKYQRFQNTISNSSSFAPVTNQQISVQVNSQTMPSKLIIFIRGTENGRVATTPDCYATITAIQAQLDNGSTILNSCPQRRLYDISRQNGLADITYPVFAGYNLSGVTGGSYNGSGSVVILDPAKDLSISQDIGMTNNSAGKYTMNFQITFNTLSTINQPTAYCIAVNDAVLIREGRNYITKLLAYSKDEVEEAKRDANFVQLSEYDEAQTNNLFLSGGSFKHLFKKLWENRHAIVQHAKQAYDIGKQAHQLYKSAKGGYMEGGYMEGGYEEGGYMEGGARRRHHKSRDGMKIYYD